MKQISLLALSMSFSICLLAQNAMSLSPEYSWGTFGASNTGCDFTNFFLNYSQFIIPLSDKEKVIPFKEGKETWGVAKINDQGKAVWQTRLSGEVRGIGKIGENILAISVDDIYKISAITATIINSATGKELQKKMIYQNNSESKLEVKIQNKPDGSFNDLLVRTTNLKGKPSVFSSIRDKEVSTANLQSISLDDKLNSKSVTLKTNIPDDIFCGSIVNNAGDIFIAEADKDNLYMFRFGIDGIQKSKITTSMSHEGILVSSKLFIDNASDDKIYLSAQYSASRKDYVFRLFAFDFDNKKAISSEEQVLNKAYQKSLELEHLKGTYSGEAKPIERLEIAGVIPWQDKIALLSEVRTDNSNQTTSNSSTIWYYNNAWILTFYDTNLKLLSTTGLDKQFQISAPLGRTLGYHLNGSHLYIVCPVVSGPAKYSTLVSDVNMSTGKIESTNKLDRDDIKNVYFIEGDATLWFDKSYLLEYIVPQNKFFSAVERHCMFQKVGY